MDCLIWRTNKQTTRGTTWQTVNFWKKKFYEILFYHACFRRGVTCLLVADSWNDNKIYSVGMILAHHLSLNPVNNLFVTAATFIFGDLSRHGITRPKTKNGSQDPQVRNLPIHCDWCWDCWINKKIITKVFGIFEGICLISHIFYNWK